MTDIIEKIIDEASSSLTIEQLADERRAAEYVCELCTAANVPLIKITPHIDDIIDRAWGLKLARAS